MIVRDADQARLAEKKSGDIRRSQQKPSHEALSQSENIQNGQIFQEKHT